MTKKSFKKTSILAILFLLPVMFLLFLYPSKHNYNALDIVAENVTEVTSFLTEEGEKVSLEGNITVLGFFGSDPMEKATVASNLKELVYDKFKGFKRFQILILVPEESESQVKLLKKELLKYDELKYWHFAYGHEQDINKVFNSLRSNAILNASFGSDHVFIIDKERNQRGRIDDRTDREMEKDAEVYGMPSYNCIKVADIKNKMSEDMRILFTEYRQKRKGNFDSTTRRADDLNKEVN